MAAMMARRRELEEIQRLVSLGMKQASEGTLRARPQSARAESSAPMVGGARGPRPYSASPAARRFGSAVSSTIC